MEQDTIDAICETPPTEYCIYDLDNDAVTGMHEENDPKILLQP